ncbi:hypothetical protein ABH917_001676 [Thermobifida halotolerans]
MGGNSTSHASRSAERRHCHRRLLRPATGESERSGQVSMVPYGLGLPGSGCSEQPYPVFPPSRRTRFPVPRRYGSEWATKPYRARPGNRFSDVFRHCGEVLPLGFPLVGRWLFGGPTRPVGRTRRRARTRRGWLLRHRRRPMRARRRNSVPRSLLCAVGGGRGPAIQDDREPSRLRRPRKPSWCASRTARRTATWSLFGGRAGFCPLASHRGLHARSGETAPPARQSLPSASSPKLRRGGNVVARCRRQFRLHRVEDTRLRLLRPLLAHGSLFLHPKGLSGFLAPSPN